MSYSYNNVLIEESNSIVKGYASSPASIARHYVKPRRSVKAIIFIKYKGVKLDPAEYKLEYINETLGTVITFPLDISKAGAVAIMYWSDKYEQPLEETREIVVYRETAPGTEAALNNYIRTRRSPIVEPSASYPIIITDKNNISTTYTNTSLISISDTNREQVDVGEIEVQAVSISYYVAEGQLAELYLDRKKQLNDIEQLYFYIQDTDGAYTNAVAQAQASNEAAELNLKLILKQSILNFFPSAAAYTSEKDQAAAIKNLWDTNKATHTYWNTANYAALLDLFGTLQTTMTNNGFLEANIYQHVNSKDCSKVRTYLALLAQLSNQSHSISSWDATNTKTFDYSGTHLGTLGNIGNLIDGTQSTYSQNNNFALRLCLDSSIFITDVVIEFLPLVDAELLLDDTNTHLSTAKTTDPRYYNDTGHSLGKQANNASFKNIIKREVHSYEFLAKIKESLKDGNGAPIQIDTSGIEFEHYILAKRDTIVIFKRTNKSANLITEVTVKKASDDIASILDNISSNERAALKAKVDAFLNDANNIAKRINAWRGDNTRGVHRLNGTIGTRDGTSYFDATATHTDAWDYVRTDINVIIDAAFALQGAFISVLSTWASETAGLFTDQNDLENKFKIWKKKQSQTESQYISAINSKHTKQKELIEKEALIEQYGTLDTPI